ncbi:MAG: hypothetical protein NZM35_07285, partial [Chitinophagales bacterium]|nr:hypothetical protein [Chitinophagales bacterium]
YVKQGKASAFSNRKGKKQTNTNPYKKLFKQGATIVPRTFYFVDLNQETPPDFKDRVINIKTPKHILGEAKKPWNTAFKGQIESNYLFLTALSKSILPFALYKPSYIVLPIKIEVNKKQKEIKLLSYRDIRREGDLYASRWFHDKENIWNILKTEKNKNITSENYLNWQNKLTDQNLNSKFIVLYNASAKDANALVIERESLAANKEYLGLEFIVESKGYAYYTNDSGEAFYLAAILNSSIPNLMMKDFQTKGLFGARDVHKKILDVYFPKFDKKDIAHTRLAELSKEAHHKAEKYLKANPPQQELTAIHLGRLRVAIKKHLASELREIDKLFKKIIA